MGLRVSPPHLSLGLLVLVLVLGGVHLHEPMLRALSPGVAEGGEGIQHLVFLHATLPRLAMAVLCGAGLAVSGAILQQVLRNPLASPDTVAVNAGARLALALCTLLAPGLLGFGRDLVAIVGALVSTALVLFIGRGRQYAPLALILAGLIVSLYAGALATIMLLLKDRYLVGLFIWGNGSLSQQSWGPAIDLSLRLGLCLIPLAVLLRPMSVLDTGEAAARSLGVPVERVRVLAIGLAVLMAAFVTSAVGVIGFIGLAGPLLTRLHGRLGLAAWCFWSGVVGALLLLVTDLCVQVLGGQIAAFLPTGALTAVIGAPLLLLMLSRMNVIAPPPLTTEGRARRPGAGIRGRAWAVGLGSLALLAVLALLALVGRAPDGGWTLLGVDMFADVLPWRMPRILGAAGAGGLLAAAGYILQRVTGNPMASPEIMGVSAGAILGAAAALMLAGAASSLGLTVSATIGSFGAMMLVMFLTLRVSFSPERVLLSGVALTAFVDALIGMLMVTGDPHSVMLLAWISGSASGTSLPVALATVAAAVLLSAIAMLGARWLTILPLGAPTAKGLGVSVAAARASMLFLVALMTAIATPVIGPLTFVGLMAPHIVLLLGIRGAASGIVLSAIVGASLMMFADALARTAAFPLQLPTGILASLLAGPFLLVLIRSGGQRAAFSPGGRE